VQIVYLSARPDVLRGTVARVRKLLPFVDRYLAVMPARLAGSLDVPEMDIVTDEELLGRPPPSDHSTRNYALRAALTTCTAVDDVFVMSDDDNRPLIELDESVFLSGARHRRYWFGWLDEWDHRSTSFDACQHATRQALALLGHPRRAYASHMPQIVDKAMFAEVVDQLAPVAARHPVCEWAAYFNIAPALHPERFADPEPYLTLGWPENPGAWQATVEPGGFAFENHFPEHYGPGAVFDGIEPDDASFESAIDRVVRWRQYELELLAGTREPTIGARPPAGIARRAGRRLRAALLGTPLPNPRRIIVTSGDDPSRVRGGS
jgi:hypothetical protein